MYRYLPLTILHLYMKYESCMLKTTQVIMSEPKCWPSSLVTLTFNPKMHRYLPLTILHLCFLSPSYVYVWNMKDARWKLLQLSCQNQSVDKVPLWHWPLTFWSQNVKVSSTHHPASMYEIWKLYVNKRPKGPLSLTREQWTCIKNLTSEWNNKRPKGPQNVHLSTMCHLFWWIGKGGLFYLLFGLKNTNSVEDVELLLHVRFCWIPFSGFRGKVKICLSQSEAREAILFFP